MKSVGHIPASSIFAPAGNELPAPRVPSVSTFPDSSTIWNAELASRRPPTNDPESLAQWTAVWDKSRKEVSSGGARSHFSKASVNRLLAFGRWRGVPRFLAQQRDRISACHDACRSGHNAATSVSEILHCDSVDCPARARHRRREERLASDTIRPADERDRLLRPPHMATAQSDSWSVAVFSVCPAASSNSTACQKCSSQARDAFGPFFLTSHCVMLFLLYSLCLLRIQDSVC